MAPGENTVQYSHILLCIQNSILHILHNLKHKRHPSFALRSNIEDESVQAADRNSVTSQRISTGDSNGYIGKSDGLDEVSIIIGNGKLSYSGKVASYAYLNDFHRRCSFVSSSLQSIQSGCIDRLFTDSEQLKQYIQENIGVIIPTSMIPLALQGVEDILSHRHCLGLFRLLPVLEQGLRIAFAYANDIDCHSSIHPYIAADSQGSSDGSIKRDEDDKLGTERSQDGHVSFVQYMYAQERQYYSTLDGFGQRSKHQLLLYPSLISSSGLSSGCRNDGDDSDRNTNKLPLLLGDGLYFLLIDLFMTEDGPNLRAQFAHGYQLYSQLLDDVMGDDVSLDHYHGDNISMETSRARESSMFIHRTINIMSSLSSGNIALNGLVSHGSKLVLISLLCMVNTFRKAFHDIGSEISCLYEDAGAENTSTIEKDRRWDSSEYLDVRPLIDLYTSQYHNLVRLHRLCEKSYRACLSLFRFIRNRKIVLRLVTDDDKLSREAPEAVNIHLNESASNPKGSDDADVSILVKQDYDDSIISLGQIIASSGQEHDSDCVTIASNGSECPPSHDFKKICSFVEKYSKLSDYISLSEIPSQGNGKDSTHANAMTIIEICRNRVQDFLSTNDISASIFENLLRKESPFEWSYLSEGDGYRLGRRFAELLSVRSNKTISSAACLIELSEVSYLVSVRLVCMLVSSISIQNVLSLCEDCRQYIDELESKLRERKCHTSERRRYIGLKECVAPGDYNLLVFSSFIAFMLVIESILTP